MARSYGPIHNGVARVYCDYTVSHTATHFNITISFWVQLVNGWSSSGGWAANYSGWWGSHTYSVHRDIGTNGTSRIVHGSYSIPRGSTNANVHFQADCGVYQAHPSHSINFIVSAKQTAPPAPTWTRPANAITADSYSVQFVNNGTGGSAITEFYLQYSDDPLFPTGRVWRWPTDLTSTYTLSGLQPRTTYYNRVYAANAIGSGPWSPVQQATTLGVPDAPSLNQVELTHNYFMGVVQDPPYVGSGISGRYTQLSNSPTFGSILQNSAMHTPEFTDLARATKYFARSQVQNSSGWSPWSDTLEFTTLATLPSAPTGYGVTDIASTTAYTTSPSVPDNGGSSIIGVRAQVNTSQSPTGALLFSEDGYRPVFLSGLLSGTAYWMRMAVQNSGAGGGWGEYGAWIPFSTKGDVPTPPRNFLATSITDTTATFGWLAPATLNGSTQTGYTFRLALNKSFSQGVKTFSPGNTTFSQFLDGLLPGTRYFVQIRANSSNGPGSWSSVTEFVTTGVAPTPEALWLRVSGQWRPGKLWQKIAGQWRQVTPWQKVSDTWRKG